MFWNDSQEKNPQRENLFKFLKFILVEYYMIPIQIKRIQKIFSEKISLSLMPTPATQFSFPKTDMITSFVCIFIEVVLCIHHFKKYMDNVMHLDFFPHLT